MYCLLKAVEAMETTLELRDEKVAEGRIDSVDVFMNIKMTDVTIKFLLNGEDSSQTGRRYVHISDEVDMKRSMEKV